MDDKILVNYLEIDGKDYIILNETDYKNSHYVYLVNENDKTDIMIKKYNDELLEPLNSREEFEELGGSVMGMTAEEYSDYKVREREKWFKEINKSSRRR